MRWQCEVDTLLGVNLNFISSCVCTWEALALDAQATSHIYGTLHVALMVCSHVGWRISQVAAKRRVLMRRSGESIDL